MKKYLYILAAVLILSIGTLTAGHIWVNSAREKMDIRETILKGDPAAAAGLSITCHARDWKACLLWDTTFTPGCTERAETDFRLSAAGEEEQFTWRSSVDLAQACDSFRIQGGGMSMDDLYDPYDLMYLMRPAEDVASRTGAGETRTETVRLADYYEHYPVSLNTFSQDYPNSAIDAYSEECGWLEDYFRVKVDETVVKEVTVVKDGNGLIDSVNMDSSGGVDGYLRSEGVVTEQGIFLIAETMDSRGNPDGRLECRDGPGVHLIRYRGDREHENVESYLELFEPQLFYPTGSARTLRLSASPDESELLLYTQEDGALALTVLDAVTGQVLQQLDLLEGVTGSGQISLIETGGLLLAITESDTFSLVSREGGRYEQVLMGALELEGADEASVLRGTHVVAWDGRRMALVSTNPSYYQGVRPDSAINVAVWDESGLCFLGSYRCGLSFDPGSEYKYARDPLSLAFTRK